MGLQIKTSILTRLKIMNEMILIGFIMEGQRKALPAFSFQILVSNSIFIEALSIIYIKILLQ